VRSAGAIGFVTLATVLAPHAHHHHQSADMVGLAIGSFASWAGVPGPGEPLLIAAAVLAARGKLALGIVLLTAFGGAVAGGIVGWLAGIKGGRMLLTRPGPLLRLRLRALRRGEEVFHRAPALSVLLAPSWVCGIHHVRSAVFLPLTVLSAAAWALGIGLAAYFVGPTVVDLVADAGTALLIALAVLIVVGVILGIRARRRSHRRATATSEPIPPAESPPPADPR
jgi:membrane protein DedA with SNARE-associated domain